MRIKILSVMYFATINRHLHRCVELKNVSEYLILICLTRGYVENLVLNVLGSFQPLLKIYHYRK